MCLLVYMDIIFYIFDSAIWVKRVFVIFWQIFNGTGTLVNNESKHKDHIF